LSEKRNNFIFINTFTKKALIAFYNKIYNHYHMNQTSLPNFYGNHEKSQNLQLEQASDGLL